MSHVEPQAREIASMIEAANSLLTIAAASATLTLVESSWARAGAGYRATELRRRIEARRGFIQAVEGYRAA